MNFLFIFFRERDMFLENYVFCKNQGRLKLFYKWGSLVRERLPKYFKRDVVLAIALAYVYFSRIAMALSPLNFVRDCEFVGRALKLLHVRTYAAETEDREDTYLSFQKISLELATGLKHVNEYDKASQGDQEVTNAGTKCSDKLELCSVSVILAKNPVDITVAAESDDNNNIHLRERGVFEIAVMKIHAKAALVEAIYDLYRSRADVKKGTFCYTHEDIGSMNSSNVHEEITFQEIALKD
ncbi:hypothetical protein AgCh_039197 [Apium graveolens]